MGAEGEVYACCFLRGNKDFSFGNVNEQSFEEIWNSDHRAKTMERVYRGECGYACQGGMTSEAPRKMKGLGPCSRPTERQ